MGRKNQADLRTVDQIMGRTGRGKGCPYALRHDARQRVRQGGRRAADALSRRGRRFGAHVDL